MADNQGSRKIVQGFAPVKLTLAAQAYCGDTLGYSAGWKPADANAAVFGEFVAGQGGVAGQVITAYRAALVGGFTSLSAGDVLYLSDTVGQYDTRSGTVSQKAGIALSDTEAWIEPKAVPLAKEGSVDATDLGVPRVAVVSMTCVFSSFTDNTNTTGFIDFIDTLPAGALVLGWKAVVATGFTGDTTAVIQVGVSGDLDRFTADVTQSVLAAATVGSNALAADAADGINAAVTPRVTVTGGADFTSITAGNMVVSIYYIKT